MSPPILFTAVMVYLSSFSGVSLPSCTRHQRPVKVALVRVALNVASSSSCDFLGGSGAVAEGASPFGASWAGARVPSRRPTTVIERRILFINSSGGTRLPEIRREEQANPALETLVFAGGSPNSISPAQPFKPKQNWHLQFSQVHSGRATPYCFLKPRIQSRNNLETMKSNNLLKIIAIVCSLSLMTGCSDNKDK